FSTHADAMVAIRPPVRRKSQDSAFRLSVSVSSALGYFYNRRFLARAARDGSAGWFRAFPSRGARAGTSARRRLHSAEVPSVAKPLVFQFGDCDLALVMNKVDRSKLYGYKEVEVLDDQGRRCELATLAGDGRTVVGRGGTGIAQLAPD